MRLALWATPLLAGILGCAHAVSRTATSTAPLDRPALPIVRSAAGQAVSFDAMVAASARADVLVIGEEHDDNETHFAELALLDGVGRARGQVVLSLEMFERDVQPAVDAYLAGRTAEADFLAASRPWERYATDYRPLVLLARSRGWPVVAANIPRPMATDVSRSGLASLAALSPASRALAAREISCPHDRYYDRFIAEMGGHSGTASGSGGSNATMDRYFEAQCVKDETMAESIAAALARGGAGTIVVHVTGSFHSDFGDGTVARVRRRSPAARIVTVSAVPSPDPETARPEPAGRADFVIFTKQKKS